MKYQILILDLLPPLNNVFALILQHEKSISVGALGTQYETNVLYANKTTGQQQKTTNMYTPGHNIRNFGGNSKRPTCTDCGFVGHTIDKCYKKYGYFLGDMPRQRNVSSINQTSIQATEAYSDIIETQVRLNSQCNILEELPFSLTRYQYQKLLVIL